MNRKQKAPPFLNFTTGVETLPGMPPEPKGKTKQARMFSDSEKGKLRKLGLTYDQIGNLERVLPVCKTRLDLPLAPMAKVRAALESIEQRLRDLLHQLTDESDPANKEAANRLLVAAFAASAQDPLASLRSVADAASSAWLALSKKQRIPIADTVPIYLMTYALGPDIDVSRTKGAQFSGIAELCYSAIGHAGSHDRAIRAYLKHPHRRRPRSSKITASPGACAPPVPPADLDALTATDVNADGPFSLVEKE